MPLLIEGSPNKASSPCIGIEELDLPPIKESNLPPNEKLFLTSPSYNMLSTPQPYGNQAIVVASPPVDIASFIYRLKHLPRMRKVL